jgi:WD40 repeat protein/tRNA A-37 threonylcarbamoyl transferase component Bud32
MSSHGSERSAHREWIRKARLQADEADRSAELHNLRAANGVVSSDFLPGYTLEAEIHRGAQGAVYRAVQLSTGRRVAVKILHEHAQGDPLERARFEREVRVLGTLRHPHIVTIHDGGTHNGRFYLVMDYIAGQPLDVFMASERRSIRQTLELFAMICEAIDAAHVRGIIHRDLKPANVRVDGSGAPHVLDFGLAKLTDDAQGIESTHAKAAVTMTGHFLGSLPWSAPEQAEGSPTRVDIRTDVYALGVLLYQMLTGKFPYPVAGPIKETLESIVHREPIPPRQLRREIDDELETILLKCLGKERERRYQTAGELGRDVRRYLNGEPIEAKRDSAWYVLRKTVRRYRLPLAVMLAFFVLLLASTVLAWTLSVRARDAAAGAHRSELAARESERLAQLRLRDSLVAQARAVLQSGQMGQRFDTLAATRKAAAIAPSLEARNTAVAAMALADLRPLKTLRQEGTGSFDPSMEHCAIRDAEEVLHIVRTQDDQELAQIPAPEGGTQQLLTVVLRDGYLVRLFDPPAGSRHLEVWSWPDPKLHMELTDVPFLARFDISPDGRRLAVGRLDRAVHIYDLASTEEIQKIELERDPSYVKIDPTGTRLALYHGNYLAAQEVDLETQRLRPMFEAQSISWAVAWHPRSEWVAGAGGAFIELWDESSRQTIRRLQGHQSQVVNLSISPDGNLLLSYSWDGVCFLWDTRSGLPLVQFVQALPVFSQDGKRIGGTVTKEGVFHVKMFEFQDGMQRARLVGTGGNGAFVEGSGAFSPDGRKLFVAQAGASAGTHGLRVFDTVTHDEVVQNGDSATWSLVADLRGRFIIGCQKDRIVRWPIAPEGSAAVLAPPETVGHLDNATTLSLSADGQWAALGNYNQEEFALLNVTTGELRRIAARWSSYQACISPDARWVAADSFNGSSGHVWDMQRGEMVKELPACYRGGVGFTPNSQRLVVSTTSGLKVYECGTWQLVQEKAGQYGSIRISPDGKMLGCMLGATAVDMLDAGTLEPLASLTPSERFFISDFAFSPDGTKVAQFTNRAGIVHLWDLRQIRAELADMGLDWP